MAFDPAVIIDASISPGLGKSPRTGRQEELRFKGKFGPGDYEGQEFEAIIYASLLCGEAPGKVREALVELVDKRDSGQILYVVLENGVPTSFI